MTTIHIQVEQSHAYYLPDEVQHRHVNQTEQEELEEKIQTLKTNMNTVRETAENAEKWIELIKKVGYPKELNAELLNTLIEKILIHEATKDEFGTRNQDIEIIYRFVGKID